MKKTIFYIILGILLPAYIKAQSTSNLWYRFSVHHKFNQNQKIELEYQYRSQGTPSHSVPWDHTLLHSYRMWWVRYVNENWTVYISPASYFQHQFLQPMGGEENFNRSNEFRSAVGLENMLTLGQSAQIKNKLGLEYRNMVESDDAMRFRYKTLLQKQLNPSMVIYGFDEIFYQHQNAALKFDQNRLGTGLNITLSHHLKSDLSFILIQRSNSQHQAILHFNLALSI